MFSVIQASVSDHDHEEEIIGLKDNNDLTNKYNGSSSINVSLIIKGTIFLIAIVFGCFVLLSSFTSPSPMFLQRLYHPLNSEVKTEPRTLESFLQRASMKDGENKTVILTILNDAWAEPNSIFDLFMESLRIGDGTARLVKHLVVICIDDKAYSRCSDSHPHCYRLGTSGTNFTDEAFFMSPSFLEMMWRRIEFLGEVLQMGYSFVFTDNDVMWLRNPFKHFSKDADFQLSSDTFNGNTYDLRNLPNTGFLYVTSNPRTIQFLKFWNSSMKIYPGLDDQDVFNRIKFDPLINDIGLRIRFLATTHFGGFCEPSRDINAVCTMHANCCVGLENKVNDLRLLLDNWKGYNSSQRTLDHRYPWSVPKLCSEQDNAILGITDENNLVKLLLANSEVKI